jgi:hypothetical protein
MLFFGGKMPYTIKYDEELDCIMVVVEGQLDLSLLKSLASDVAKAIEKYGSRRILNDLRRARLKGVVDAYHMPRAAEESGVTLRCRRALVVGEASSDFDFLETVFLNQGHVVKMFVSIDDARHWLLEG